MTARARLHVSFARGPLRGGHRYYITPLGRRVFDSVLNHVSNRASLRPRRASESSWIPGITKLPWS
jgi:hypothetical protein